jgi:hypothetical protein
MNLAGISIDCEAMTVEQAPIAAQLIAACRDHVQDGIYAQAYEVGFWTSRINLCMQRGHALAMTVNGGNVAGAVLILPDDMNPGRAVLMACESMWSPETTKPWLEGLAKDWARDNGLSLGRQVHIPARIEWVPV